MEVVRYQLAPYWVLRHDEHRHDCYTLFDIRAAKMYTINRSIFRLLSFIEASGKRLDEVVDFFGQENEIDYSTVFSNLNKQWDGLVLNTNAEVRVAEHPRLQFTPRVPVCSSPRTAEIQLTTQCNLECLHCLYSCGRNSQNELISGEEWVRILRELEANRMRTVTLTGGELFTHPDIDTIIEALGKMRMQFVILTNAMLITPERARMLAHPNILLSISLDGNTEESHDFLRGAGAYRVLMRKMELLASLGMERVLSVTLHAQNTGQIEGLVEYALANNVKALNFTILDDIGRAQENRILHLTRAQRRDCKQRIQRLQKQYAQILPIVLLDPEEGFESSDSGSPHAADDEPVTCTGAISHIAIATDGSVYPCVYAFGVDTLFAGRMTERTLGEIWNTDKWSLLRGGITMQDLHQCKSCTLRSSCQTKSCRVRALKYKGDLYAAPKCVAFPH